MAQRRFMLRRRTRRRLLRASARAVGVIAEGVGRAVIWCMKMAGRGFISAIMLMRRRPFASMRHKANGNGATATGGPTQVEVPAEAEEARRLAVDVLVTWGDRRTDAKRSVAEAAALNPGMDDAGELVRAAYRMRRRGPAGRQAARSMEPMRG
jgi:hypothetical protein